MNEESGGSQESRDNMVTTSGRRGLRVENTRLSRRRDRSTDGGRKERTDGKEIIR